MDTRWMRDLLDRYDRLHEDMRRFNAPRDFYLALLRSHRMNGLDGAAIADWLEAHPDHWTAIYIGPTEREEVYRLLEDQARGATGPLDALYVLTDRNHLNELSAAAREVWRADEQTVFGPRRSVILRCWWD